MKELLELNKVTLKGINKYRLENIQLSIYEGDRIALLGKSGAGKSTLISIANGSIKPSKGEVRWKGLKLNSLRRSQRVDIATLWQDLRLLEELNVQQNINAGILGRKNLYWAFINLMGNIDTNKCLPYLLACGLTKDLLNIKVSRLSGGQRQRVAIARLLRQKATLILADEPFSSLDPRLSQEIIDLFFRYRKASKINVPKTFLISLHRLDLIHQFTRVIGLKKGKVVIDIPTKELNSSELKWLYKD